MVINLKAIFILPYILMMLIGLTLPSDGNHTLLSPKSLSFICAFFSTGLFLILRNRLTPFLLNVIGFGLGVACFLLSWFILGIYFDPDQTKNAFDQTKLFLITVSVAVMTLFMIHEKLLTAQQILKIVIFGNFFYSLMKLTLVILHLLHLINMWDVLDMLGIRFMSMLILQDISRLQTSVDIITPFLLFFVLESDPLHLNLSHKFKKLYLFVSILSIFLSFSRFLIIVGAISFLLHWFTLSMGRITKRILILLLWAIALLLFIGMDHSVQIFEQRFLSQDNALSDYTRVEQIHALLNGFNESPYLGLGMGGVTKELIRDHEIQHSYEVQWMAFLMQFGMIGILFLLFPLGLICKTIMTPPFTRVKEGFCFLFLMWIVSGFTNPFLISLTSGIVYSIFLTAGMILAEPISDDVKEEPLSQNFRENAIPHTTLLASSGYNKVDKK